MSSAIHNGVCDMCGNVWITTHQLDCEDCYGLYVCSDCYVQYHTQDQAPAVDPVRSGYRSVVFIPETPTKLKKRFHDLVGALLSMLINVVVYLIDGLSKLLL